MALASRWWLWLSNECLGCRFLLFKVNLLSFLFNYCSIPLKRDRSASLGGNESAHNNPLIVEQNRTMVIIYIDYKIYFKYNLFCSYLLQVFLVGRSDLRLISPDKKQILLYKDFKDIASCCQGHENSEYFGIICREPQNDGYIGYVFKCASESVSDDITAAVSLAFNTCSEQKKKENNQVFSCELCPMLWFSKLCSDIEGNNRFREMRVFMIIFHIF
jgi:hypothetical protein